MNASELLNSTVECRKFGPYNGALTVVNWSLAFFGNILTILTMLNTKDGIGKKGKAYIICLSCFDLMMAPILLSDLILGTVGGLCQPMFPPYTQDQISRVPVLRRNRMIFGAAYFISLVGSLLTMFAISVDRLLAVSKPLFYKHVVTLTKIRITLAIIWMYVTITGSFIFGYFGQQGSDVQVLAGLYNGAILPSWAYNYLVQPHLYASIIGTFLGSGLAIRFIKKLDQKPGTGGTTGRSSARTKRFLRMTMATLGFLLLLNCPFLLATSMLDDQKGSSPRWAYNYILMTAYFFTMCNSGVNPLIYSWFNEDFKRAYKRMLRIGNSGSRVNPSSDTGTISVIPG